MCGIRRNAVRGDTGPSNSAEIAVEQLTEALFKTSFARAMAEISELAAPVAGDTRDGYGNDIVNDGRLLVRDAISVADVKALNVR